MDARELRMLSAEEIANRVTEAETEYAALREAVRSGKEPNHGKLKSLKRNVARAKTVWQEKKTAAAS